jgi:hypothetical protein
MYIILIKQFMTEKLGDLIKYALLKHPQPCSPYPQRLYALLIFSASVKERFKERLRLCRYVPL